MNFADKLGNFLNEAAYSTSYADSMYKPLKGFYASDKPVNGNTYIGSEDKEQVVNQVVMNKRGRDSLFDKIDAIKYHHLSTTIKSILIDDCFSSLCDKTLCTIQYLDEDDKEKSKLFGDAMNDFIHNTYFFDIFKDCLINEGFDYGEIFLSTDCKVGEGIIEISDDIDLRKHIALYKNLVPVGYMRFNNTDKNDINADDFIEADALSHFMVNPRKIPLKINYTYNKSYDLPEKIRCAEPILTPVIDLISSYNQLEQVRTAIELNKALAPILLSIAVNSNSDMTEIRKQLQEHSIALNKTRNSIINNLNNLNVSSLLTNMNNIQLIPFDTSAGTNKIEQITINPMDNNITEKLNDLKITIAQAVGVPESYVATTTLKEDKKESILTNPRYSRMLSGIQQSLTRGIVEMLYKHLKYKYSKIDPKSKRMFMVQEVDRHKIEVKFKTVTNIDNALDMEQMLLVANTMGEIASVIDLIAGSTNLPIRTNPDKVLALINDVFEEYPKLRDTFEEDPNHGTEEEDYGIGSEDDLGDDNFEGDDVGDNSIENEPNPAEGRDIKDVFK